MLNMAKTSKDKLIRLRQIIEYAVSLIEDDAMAIEATVLFPEWAPDVSYKAGTRIKYKDVLYRALKDHKSKDTAVPGESPKIYEQVIVSE